MTQQALSTTHVRTRTSQLERRIRANRVSLEDALGRSMLSVSSAGERKTIAGRLLDVSLHGAGVAIDASSVEVESIRLGDRLPRVTFAYEDLTIFDGPAVVVHSRRDSGLLALGLSLHESSVDVAAIERLTTRRAVASRWARARDEQPFSRVDALFRAWVADLATDLENARAFLDAEQAALGGCDLASRSAISRELLHAVAPDVIARMNRAGSELRALVGDQSKQGHEVYRAYLQHELGGLLAASPFLNRARAKPLGYAGDYEMMNMLYRDHAEGESLFGKALNMYATQSPVAQANINRIEFLGAKIEAAIAASSAARVRIASIGCGPAQEIQTFLSTRPALGTRLEVALLDQEERAISCCERALAPLAAATGARIRVIRESVRRLLTDQNLVQSLGECQLLYSAGLFDYLSDRTFDALLGKLYGAVARGGVLAIGNVAALNPDRFAMEYFTEWFLNHRSPEDLLARGHTLSPKPRSVEVEAEPLGVNLFLVVQR